MFKISIVETHGQRRLVLEGKLVPPWTAEVESAWRSAGEQLKGRKLVIDLADVTVIGADGENMLLKLMRDGARFSCCGVMTRHVLKQLARRCRGAVTRSPLDNKLSEKNGAREINCRFFPGSNDDQPGRGES